MVMQIREQGRTRKIEGAWQSVVSAWEERQKPTASSKQLSKEDIRHIRAKDISQGVGEVRSARSNLFRWRNHHNQEAQLASKDREGKSVPLSLLDRVLKIFQNVSFEVSNARIKYNREVGEQLKSLVEQHGGKTFTRKEDTPTLLLLASVPKGKENTDLSMKTLINKIDDLKEKLESAEGKRSDQCKHAFRVYRSPDHIVLYRVVDGKEETIEMSFRRAGKVDIFLNGSPKPQGSQWNDDAFRTAEAFLKGKDVTFTMRGKAEQKQAQYVVRKDPRSLEE
jgi:hypothetical protein